jgi:NTP pyrophosphatase (non-canonical NTP hydrolase)
VGLTEQFCENIVQERIRQYNKWGLQVHGGHAWLGILAEEFGEVAKAINDNDMDEVKKELEQVAAVACAMWEQLVDAVEIDLNPQFGIFGKDK